MRASAADGPRRTDRRRLGALLTLAGVLLGGLALQGREHAPAPDRAALAQHANDARRAEVKRRFDEAVVMLHARQYEHAAAALHRVLALDPTMPEAHVNMGFALLGLQRLKEARDFFEGATDLRRDQANAYYGLALVSEAQGDLPMAIGAMRSYLHLAGADASEAHLRRARAALWTWESARPAR